MRGFNKVIITGNLTRDPELRTIPSGAQVCSFAVAVNRSYKDGAGNLQEEVSFIDCNAWGKAGEIINQYCRRGSGILVCGRLRQHSWDDKETGKKRSRVDVVVEDFNFLGAGSGEREGGFDRSNFGTADANMSTSEASASAASADVVPEDIPEEDIKLDEIPF